MYDDELDDGFHEAVIFDATMRCDGCNARAIAVAQKSNKSDLLFCLHHLKKHYDALLEDGWYVIEDYEALEAMNPALLPS